MTCAGATPALEGGQPCRGLLPEIKGRGVGPRRHGDQSRAQLQGLGTLSRDGDGHGGQCFGGASLPEGVARLALRLCLREGLKLRGAVEALAAGGDG